MSEVSRRTAVLAGAAGAGVGAVVLATQAAPALGWSAPGAPTSARNPFAIEAGSLPMRSHFVPAIGETFDAVDGERSLKLTLTAVEDLAPVLKADDENRFNLIFSGSPADAHEGIFTLRRNGTPTTTLFLSPIGTSAATQPLQAIVNRHA
ncbi:DUF6916 family protein [Leifsonia sp. NPDC058230]|uniref:DUF6916 family protein n=1 Tax=Leifsonia sp. NPDC058230 TaxID=3346391 RepID=UPI0036D7CC99